LNQLQSDIDGPAVRDLGSLELALKTMWEKARAAGDMIARLQTEKAELQSTVQELERSLSSLRSELAVKEHDMKKLRAEHAQLSSLDQKNVFSEEEKEMIRGKVKDLISKINSHL
jgi:Tfp pilus assembly protein FimV